jgi:hypothetical protein
MWLLARAAPHPPVREMCPYTRTRPRRAASVLVLVLHCAVYRVIAISVQEISPCMRRCRKRAGLRRMLVLSEAWSVCRHWRVRTGCFPLY